MLLPEGIHPKPPQLRHGVRKISFEGCFKRLALRRGHHAVDKFEYTLRTYARQLAPLQLAINAQQRLHARRQVHVRCAARHAYSQQVGDIHPPSQFQ